MLTLVTPGPLFVHNAISEVNGAFTINGAATAAKGSTLEQLLRDWLASPPNAFQDLKGKLLVAKVGGEGGDGDVYGAEYGGVEGAESDVYVPRAACWWRGARTACTLDTLSAPPTAHEQHAHTLRPLRPNTVATARATASGIALTTAPRRRPSSPHTTHTHTHTHRYADGEELPSSAVYTAGLEAQQSSIEFQLGSQSSTHSSADVLGSHSVGKATRQEAEAMLTGRGQIKGDFVLRQSKGASVLTCVGKGNNFLHHKLSEDGVSVLVNGKTTATAASTVSDALRDWVADPFVSNKDLKIELVRCRLLLGRRHHASRAAVLQRRPRVAGLAAASRLCGYLVEGFPLLCVSTPHLIVSAGSSRLPRSTSLRR